MSARRKTPARSPPSTYSEPISNGVPPPNSSPTMPLQQRARHSPLLPTALETLLLSLYPLTLVLGSLFTILSPSIRASSSAYSGTTQSYDPPHLAPSYFAQKKNVFNVYFVKVGWFWTTLALFVFIFTHPSHGPPGRPILTPRRLKAAARWAIATALWCAVTQWFFGPPLIDRTFSWSGGQCELLRDRAAVDAMSDSRHIATHAACKLVGGAWKGGHDISGHVFLLILGSGLLWMEVLPCMLRASGLRESRLIRMHDGKVASAAAEAERETHRLEGREEQVASLGTKVVLGVMGLSLWMLLMTAAFFHTWFEKFTGLGVAFLGLWVVYFLPRGVPALRAVLGMPGV